jgi:hypothetical protein
MKNKIFNIKLEKEEIIIYSLILIVLTTLIAVLIIHAFTNYLEFKENKNYFINNPNPKIDTWMTPDTILRHFNITEEDLFKELNIKEGESTLRTPLYKICIKQEINCFDLVEKLNNLIK